MQKLGYQLFAYESQCIFIHSANDFKNIQGSRTVLYPV